MKRRRPQPTLGLAWHDRRVALARRRFVRASLQDRLRPKLRQRERAVRARAKVHRLAGAYAAVLGDRSEWLARRWGARRAK